MSSRVIMMIMESSLGLVAGSTPSSTRRQTTHCKSAPLKSQPAQFVAQIWNDHSISHLHVIDGSHTFSPLITHSSPTFRAVVFILIPPGSSQFALPSGSENTKLAMGVPSSPVPSAY